MSANRPKINDKKTSFLSGTPLESHQLKASELHDLVSFYNSKINRNTTKAADTNKIKILINGTSEQSKKIIAAKQNKIKKQMTELQDDKLKYALFIKELWMSRSNGYMDINGPYEISRDNYKGVYQEIINLIYPYLNYQDEIKKNLSSSEMTELNNIIKNSSLATLIDGKINEYITNKLQKDMEDIGLNVDEMKSEVLEIQKKLKPGELRGYIYTNGHSVEKDHFEVLIISKDGILKPVEWNLNDYKKEIHPHIIPNLSATICKFPVVELIQYGGSKPNMQVVLSEGLNPQAGMVECGTLGIMYLKELLKNGASQLKQLTMQFAIPVDQYTVGGDKSDTVLMNFFFPSPQVLAYSQVSLYNKMILAMLETEPSIQVKHVDRYNTEKIYKVKTLKTLLEESIMFLKNNNPKKNADTIKKYQELLANLPNFTEQWKKEYAHANAKRQEMQKEMNYYLNYKTHKKERIDELKSSTAVVMQTISAPPSPPPLTPPVNFTPAKAPTEGASNRTVVTGLHRAEKTSAAPTNAPIERESEALPKATTERENVKTRAGFTAGQHRTGFFKTKQDSAAEGQVANTENKTKPKTP